MKVHFETSGPLAILALANPPLNLLSGELLDELGAAVRELKRLPIRALMLRAEGKVFSAGADVSAIRHEQLFVHHRRRSELVNHGNVDVPLIVAGFLLR